MLAQLSVQRSGWIFVLSNALKVGEMYSHQMNFVLFSIKALKRFSVCCFVVLKFKILAMTWLNFFFFFFFSQDTHYLQISHVPPYKASCGRWPIFHIWKKFDPIMLKLLLFIILDLNSCLFWVISMQFAYIGFLSLAAFQYVIWLPSTSMCYFAEGEDGKKNLLLRCLFASRGDHQFCV